MQNTFALPLLKVSKASRLLEAVVAVQASAARQLRIHLAAAARQQPAERACRRHDPAMLDMFLRAHQSASTVPGQPS